MHSNAENQRHKVDRVGVAAIVRHAQFTSLGVWRPSIRRRFSVVRVMSADKNYASYTRYPCDGLNDTFAAHLALI